MRSDDLDRYITGNYGEDQLQGEVYEMPEFQEGAEAQKKGILLKDNPYSTQPQKQAWRMGWVEEDMSQMNQEDE